MPLSMARILGMLHDMKFTSITLQLADKSLVRPDEILENVCIQLDKTHNYKYSK